MKQTNFIRIFSDLHLDFDVQKNFEPSQLWMPPELDTDNNTTLVLAGDIWHAKKMLSFSKYSWLTEVSKRFQYVVLVLGNHDFWGGNVTREYQRVREFAATLGNVFLLQNSTLEIGEHKFLGTTLWTDFGDGKFLHESRKTMNDYKFSRYGESFAQLRPELVLKEHMMARKFIENNRDKKEGQKLWVITHHLPTEISLDEPQEHEAYDYSNLEHLMGGVDFWVHGHSHIAKDYVLHHNEGDTRIISQPRGYTDQLTEYNPYFVLDINKSSRSMRRKSTL